EHLSCSPAPATFQRPPGEQLWVIFRGETDGRPETREMPIEIEGCTLRFFSAAIFGQKRKPTASVN
ncbi:MAG TPA: hypothetical protein VNH22_17980, partial [Blastocatellia bacterium]|nr:hypothetical protein [Blastocatellia bacterium]